MQLNYTNKMLIYTAKLTKRNYVVCFYFIILILMSQA